MFEILESIGIGAAFGTFGGIVGTLSGIAFQRWLRRRDELSERRYRELRESFSGLLKALDKYPQTDGIDPGRDVRYWLSRVLLVCPKESLEFWFDFERGGLASLRGNRGALLLNMRHDLNFPE